MDEELRRAIVDRRMRTHLMEALEQAARARDLESLLAAEWMDLLEESVEVWGPNGAISDEERAAVLRLYRTWAALGAEEARILRERSGGKVVHHHEDLDLLRSLDWFEKVHPLVRAAYGVFLKRGWLSAGLWDEA